MQMGFDGLENVATGLGTNKSKRSAYNWTYDVLNNWQQLDAAYQTNWITRAIVDIPAKDMVREWRRIKANDAEEIERAEKHYKLKKTVQKALSWSRLFGGAGVLMLTNQDLTQPLDIRKVGKGDLKRLIVFDRHEMNGVMMNTWNVLAENYLQPELFTIQGGQVNIHWSHFAKFMGEDLPRRQQAQTQGWGDSVLRKCMEDVNDTVSAKGGIAELMTEANIDIIKRDGLSEELASDQDQEIIKRYEMFSLLKSVVHMALLDENETFDRKTLQMSGVPQTLEVLMMWLAGAARIPVTKLFGSSAKGLNATGEGDLKTYYDDIRSIQDVGISEPLALIDEVMIRSTLGAMPDDYDYVWNPLAQENPVEAAQSRLYKAQTDQVYIDSGVIQVSQVQRNLQSDEVYQFQDGMIDKLEALEDPLMFDEEVDEAEEEED